MRVIKTKDYADMSRKAANIISAQVILKPDCVLGLATGSTPVSYTHLDVYKRQGIVIWPLNPLNFKFSIVTPLRFSLFVDHHRAY